MKNVALCVLPVAVGVLASLAYSQDKTICDQKVSLQDLTSKLQETATKSSLDLQEKCAKQDRAQFKADGWEKEPSATLVNHYDEGLNKCFSLETNTAPSASTPDQFVTNAALIDAFEGKVFGIFMTVSQKTKNTGRSSRSCAPWSHRLVNNSNANRAANSMG